MSEMLLDCRSRTHRRVQERWADWNKTTPAWLPPLARATEFIREWSLASRLDRRGAPPVFPLILSVGNLSTGGAGKTPVVMKLAAEFTRMGRTGSILTRGYGSTNSGPVIVDSTNRSCGDEARIMARNLPGWCVAQSRNRRAGLDWLKTHQKTTPVIIVEDGHQTAGVPRHLDILLLDGWRLHDGCIEPLTGNRLPWGPYRESAKGAERAGIWVIRPGEDLDNGIRGCNGAEILQLDRRLDLPAIDPDKCYGLLSGIAGPEKFEADCRRLLNRPAAIVARFDDHAVYTRQVLKPVLAAGRERGVDVWLTTEKDQIKLESVWPQDLDLITAKLRLDWIGDKSLAQTALALIEGKMHEHR